MCVYGIYELATSRYELLTSLQGSLGVADPTVLQSYLEPSASISAVGRQAYRRERTQLIRAAAQSAGRKRANKQKESKPTISGTGQSLKSNDKGRGKPDECKGSASNTGKSGKNTK